MEVEEKSKQRFEIRKLFIGAILTFIFGIVATGVWKWYDKKPEWITVTINPSDGNTRRTLHMEIYKNLTGKISDDNIEYSISKVVFQSEDRLIYNMQDDDFEIEMNGFYDPNKKKYVGVAINKSGTNNLSILDWEAVIK